MGVAIAIINEQIRLGNVKGEKINGILNTSDIGTKPLPSSTFHRHFRQGRGQRFYPSADTEHGQNMQVEMVNQRLTEFDDNNSPTYIDYTTKKNMAAVYDHKEASKRRQATQDS